MLEIYPFYGKIMSKYETKPTIKISMKGEIKMFLYVWFFILGTIVGSFFQLCMDRLPLGLDVIKGRSFCFRCFHPLQWKDLIPVMSFVLLKGRCRYCQRRISLRYPLFEILSGLLLVFMVYYITPMGKAFLLYLLIMDFITLTVIDKKWQIIPDFTLLLEAVLTIGLIFYIDVPFYERIIGMFIISLPMFLMNQWVIESFGGGDIKLMFISGFLLGYVHILLAFCIAVIVGGLYAWYLLIRQKAHRHSYIAFGGFLCLGILVSLFYGELILSFYCF